MLIRDKSVTHPRAKEGLRLARGEARPLTGNRCSQLPGFGSEQLQIEARPALGTNDVIRYQQAATLEANRTSGPEPEPREICTVPSLLDRKTHFEGFWGFYLKIVTRIKLKRRENIFNVKK